MTFIAACHSHKKSSTPPQADSNPGDTNLPAPQATPTASPTPAELVLDLNGMPRSSFASYDLDKRCEALRAFMAYMVEKYGQDTKAQDQSCDSPVPGSHLLSVTLKKNDITMTLQLQTRGDNHMATGSIAIAPTAGNETPSIDDFAKLSSEFPKLPATFAAFLQDSNAKPRIFGRDYQFFLKYLQTFYNERQVPLMLAIDGSNDRMRASITLLPLSADQLDKGTVRFSDTTVFPTLQGDANIFECTNRDCLNSDDQPIQYRVLSNALLITKTIPVTGKITREIIQTFLFNSMD